MKPIKSLQPAGAEAMQVALDLLQQGALVGLPTETVYGLAADATNGEAVASIYAAKGRPQFNPLISHVDGLEMARKFANFDARASKLAELFWPGSLTMVLPKYPDCAVNELVTAGLDTIALRCPNNEFTRALICAIQKPLAAPSANISGQLSPTTADDVRNAFPENALPFVVDGGPCPVGLESTIVSCLPGEAITVLRPGAVTLDDLQAIFGQDGARVHTPVDKDQSQPAAPGMLLSHYAPKAPLVIVEAGQVLTGNGALLTFLAENVTLENNGMWVGWRDLSPAGDMKEAASNLFSMLRELDALEPETIYVISPPQVGLGIAIYDRLQRAAAPRINGAAIRES